MGLPRTFVGFSSTDTHMYRTMCMWKSNENIEFNFCDCQLEQALHSEDENYIKQRCKEQLNMAGTYIMLIGQDTRYKHKYVRWEAEVAIDKKSRLIAVNLDGWRKRNDATCPPIITNVGAIFVPFSAKIIAYALEHWDKRTSDAWFYKDDVYTELGYTLVDNRAIWPSSTMGGWFYGAKVKTLLGG